MSNVANSVIVPVYNAKACLEELISRIEAALAIIDAESELILWDDASTDGSYEELVAIKCRKPCIIVERNSTNVGQHATILRGLALATGQVSVILDCDLQDDPALIPALVQRLEKCRADAVIVRYRNYSNGLIRYCLSRAHSLARALRGLSNNDPRIAVYRAFGTELKTHLMTTYRTGMRLRDIFEPEAWHIEFLEATRARRFSGTSSYSWTSLVKTALGRR